MAAFASIIPTYDGEEHVVAALQHLMKVLGANRNLDDDMRRFLADFDNRLSTMTRISENQVDGTREVEEQLKFAQKKVMSWESNRAMIWASGSEAASDYLQAVYEVQRLMESSRSLLSNRSGKQKELFDQAYSVLQMAMERLEEELLHILAYNRQSVLPEYGSFRTCEEDIVSDQSIVSTEDGSIEYTTQRDRSGTETDERVFDLVHPDVISDIKAIANVMFASHYDQEFCHAFTNFWEDALDDYFVILGFDKLSIEDVLKMKWENLNRKIKKWIRAMKFIRVYLPSEKRLFELVLGEFGSPCSTCFVEASKGSMLSLLNFGHTMVIGPLRPEKLFELLDMYRALADLLPVIDSLFSEEVGSFMRTEFHELLLKLGDATRATFMKLGDEIASNTSTNPFAKGGIHHLTKYVMNYMTPIVEYTGTLNLLLGVQGGGEELVPNGENIYSDNCSPLARHLRSLTSNLKLSLDHKSRLYKDGAMKHIFMMNNIRYMVKKVQVSEICSFFGDEWIRDYTWKFQQHERSYERVTWSPVLDLLRIEGNMSKAILKQRCRDLYIAFEEICKGQTGWLVPDPELRKDLRISTSQKVIPAYRAFISKISSLIGEKHIKYTADELEDHILDLFEELPISLHNIRKR